MRNGRLSQQRGLKKTNFVDWTMFMVLSVIEHKYSMVLFLSMIVECSRLMVIFYEIVGVQQENTKAQL